MRLVVERGELAGQEFALEEATVMIGRGQENDIHLAEPGTSRQHARLQHKPQGWTLTDLGSTNGTSVNGQRLRPHEVYLLRPGDRIAIGSSVLVVEEPAASQSTWPVPKQRERHPALLVAGALLLVVALSGIVVVLVIMLQPQQEAVTPTPMNQIQQLITALPVPTEFQDIVTSVIPLIPTGLPLLPPGETTTPPPPGAAVPAPSIRAQNGGASP
jgi:hypothetical protein